MVRLNRIYTRSGDDGSTGLGDGSRLPKHHVRVAAYGTIDEVNSVVGLALCEELPEGLAALLKRVQNELFDAGADLSVPGEGGARLRLQAGYVERLEREIDDWNERLAPLSSFILPGGSKASAWLHLARTVCRRAERLVSELALLEGEGRVNPVVLRYLNRLSDLFFVAARIANDEGRADVLWEPGASREPDGDTGEGTA